MPAEAFPAAPLGILGIVADPESGLLYVTDVAARKVYRITPQKRVSVILDEKILPSECVPCSLAMDGASHLLMTDPASGALYRIKLADASTEKLAEVKDALLLAWDNHGRLFITDKRGDAVHVIPRPGQKPVQLAQGFEHSQSICLGPTGKHLLVVDTFAGTLTAIPITVPGAEVEMTPFAVETAVAFPDLQWTGWDPETAKGKPNPFRPILLTHAGDGSNRVFVAQQEGVVHLFSDDQKVTKTKVFLDLRDRVSFNEQTNEEGFLGLAFHPKFKQNGEFFVFYTTKKAKLTNVVSRFKVRKDDPDRADPDSEEELLRFTKPFWNHDGGTLCFGPDGYLYITHGDGGAANDPFENGQNLKSLLGKIHRIDVDHKDGNKPYAIPADNPFVGRADARPEIWAYGLRNVWRMAFDRKTGKLWAGDVGQNLYEEIDIIERGGNYGWNRREGLHPFGPKGSGPRKDMTDPIWEYHHDLGKCIIGGTVYRGPGVRELQGYYLYADYVTSKLWALRFDEAKGRVVENRSVKNPGRAFVSFGEDEKGEVYLLTHAADGKAIYRFVKTKP